MLERDFYSGSKEQNIHVYWFIVEGTHRIPHVHFFQYQSDMAALNNRSKEQ